jgi:hypothetical protein
MGKMAKEHEGTDSPTPQHDRSRLIPVTHWNRYHVWPPVGGLRHLIFYEKSNGFDHCVVRIGRRVLIDEEKFHEWAEQQR